MCQIPVHVIVLVDPPLLFPFTLWQPIPPHLWVNLWVERERRETHETDAGKNKNTPHWQKNFRWARPLPYQNRPQ